MTAGIPAWIVRGMGLLHEVQENCKRGGAYSGMIAWGNDLCEFLFRSFLLVKKMTSVSCVCMNLPRGGWFGWKIIVFPDRHFQICKHGSFPCCLLYITFTSKHQKHQQIFRVPLSFIRVPKPLYLWFTSHFFLSIYTLCIIFQVLLFEQSK